MPPRPNSPPPCASASVEHRQRVRIFLDANVLFSAAQSDGAVRMLLRNLHVDGYVLVADAYVATEAIRNIAAKSGAEAMDYLKALLSRIEVSSAHPAISSNSLAEWLPDKDRPVLLAAMSLRCDALVTGDRTHFGVGYGGFFGGVTIYSPAQLAQALFANKGAAP